MGGMSFAYEPYDDRRMIMLHGAQDPTMKEWDAYLADLRDKDVTTLGLLVFTSGGAPNAAQRRALNNVLLGRYFARAVVNDSTIVRGIIAAVGWFAPGVQPFRPGEWKQAAAFARFKPEEIPAVAERVRILHRRLSQPIQWLEASLAGS